MRLLRPALAFSRLFWFVLLALSLVQLQTMAASRHFAEVSDDVENVNVQVPVTGSSSETKSKVKSRRIIESSGEESQNQ